MPDGALDALGRLVEEGEDLVRHARAAENASASPGSDPAGAVSVTLDAQGRVSRVSVPADWRRRVGVEGLSGAVVQAVRDASIRRFTAWGAAFGEQSTDVSGATADRDDFQRRLQAVATGDMSAEDRRAALSELLELAEAIERGIDEVSGKLQAALEAGYTGRSPDGRVTVTMTGGGEPTAVRFDRAWLRQAHEVNIGRQVAAAFRSAYEIVAAHGVRKLISESALGEVQRRLRMTD